MSTSELRSIQEPLTFAPRPYQILALAGGGYVRLIIIGNARTNEIEALMDEEIATIKRDRLKGYRALTAIADIASFRRGYAITPRTAGRPTS